MKWKSETEQQRRERLGKAHEVFAIFPVKCKCGTWVWLEHYWRRMCFGPNQRMWWERCVHINDFFPLITAPVTPPPTKPAR